MGRFRSDTRVRSLTAGWPGTRGCRCIEFLENQDMLVRNGPLSNPLAKLPTSTPVPIAARIAEGVPEDTVATTYTDFVATLITVI